MDWLLLICSDMRLLRRINAKFMSELYDAFDYDMSGLSGMEKCVEKRRTAGGL